MADLGIKGIKNIVSSTVESGAKSLARGAVGSALEALTGLPNVYTIQSYVQDNPPMRSHLWQLNLPEFEIDALKEGFSGYYVPKVVGISFRLPETTTKQFTQAGWKYNYPESTVQSNALTMKWYADESCRSFAYYEIWRRYIRDPETGLENLPSTYKRGLRLKLFRGVGSPVAEFVFQGVFPLSMSEVTLTSGESGSVIPTHTVSFSVDEVALVKVNDPRSLATMLQGYAGSNAASQLSSLI